MRVLLVDDHRSTRDSLALGLSLLGIDVHTEGSADGALRELERTAFDHLVCDVRMPGGGGVDLAERAVAGSPGLPVTFMTAYDLTADERRRARVLGAKLLIKPVTAEVLARHLEQGPASIATATRARPRERGTAAE